MFLFLLPDILFKYIVPFFEKKLPIEIVLDWSKDYYSSNYFVFKSVWGLLLLISFNIFLNGVSHFFQQIQLLLKRYFRLLIIFLVSVSEIAVIYYLYDFLISSENTSKKFNFDHLKWLGPTITMLVAAPVAFFIWSFRDMDKREDLKHAEMNIRQADFHKIEEWASTDADTEAHVLQNAAIYQLLPYLKGEYGDRYIRPSMEIYRSLLSSWRWDEIQKELAENGESLQIDKPPYINVLHTIIRQEFEFFRKFHEHPICKNSNWVPLDGIDLKAANLTDIDFGEANLKNADLRGANFNGADLSGALLDDAKLKGANLKNATYSEIWSMNLNGQTILKNGNRYIAPIDKCE